MTGCIEVYIDDSFSTSLSSSIHQALCTWVSCSVLDNDVRLSNM